MPDRPEHEVIAEAYSDEALRTWKAPVQGYLSGIPWPMHLQAYDVYCKRYGRQTALIDLRGRGCRGGFGTEELDGFIPGWRDRVSYLGRMNARIAALKRTYDRWSREEIEQAELNDAVGKFFSEDNT